MAEQTHARPRDPRLLISIPRISSKSSKKTSVNAVPTDSWKSLDGLVAVPKKTASKPSWISHGNRYGVSVVEEESDPRLAAFASLMNLIKDNTKDDEAITLDPATPDATLVMAASVLSDTPAGTATKTDIEMASTTPIPREYQLELLRRAQEQNVIAVLPTGSGKTLIAVLLIKWIHGEELKQSNVGLATPSKPMRVSVFLANKVHLATQQTRVIEEQTSFKVRVFVGAMGVDEWSRERWRKELAGLEVLVFTTQVFLNLLRMAVVKMDEVNLLVFDEVHDAVANHPMRLVMKEFYHTQLETVPNSVLPKIFCMTASPCNGGRAQKEKLKQLETTMDCSLFMVTEKLDELMEHNRPADMVRVYYRQSTCPTTAQLSGALSTLLVEALQEEHQEQLKLKQGIDGTESTKNMQRQYLYSFIKQTSNGILSHIFVSLLDNDYLYFAQTCGISVAELFLANTIDNLYRHIVQRLPRRSEVAGARAGELSNSSTGLPELDNSAAASAQATPSWLNDLRMATAKHYSTQERQYVITAKRTADRIRPTISITPATVSPKIRALVDDILTDELAKPNFTGIIFVQRRSLAIVLCEVLQRLMFSKLKVPDTIITTDNLNGASKTKVTEVIDLTDDLPNSDEAIDSGESTADISADNDIESIVRTANLAVYPLIGHGSGGMADNVLENSMPIGEQTRVLSWVRQRKIRLLVATNIAEEGLDMPACNVVIRFDLPMRLISFVQSRGRARDRDSIYYLLVNSNDPEEMSLANRFAMQEKQVTKYCRKRSTALDNSDSSDSDQEDLQEIYRVPTTGATLTSASAVSLINAACQKLPSREYYTPTACFTMHDERTPQGVDGRPPNRPTKFRRKIEIDPVLVRRARETFLATVGVSSMSLVSTTDTPKRSTRDKNSWWLQHHFGSINMMSVAEENSLVYRCVLQLPEAMELQPREWVSEAHSNKKKARQDVAFKACIAMHKAGLLTDQLRPRVNEVGGKLNGMGDDLDDSAKPSGSSDKDTTELHSMHIPTCFDTSVIPAIPVDLTTSDDKEGICTFFLTCFVCKEGNDTLLPMGIVTREPVPILSPSLIIEMRGGEDGNMLPHEVVPQLLGHRFILTQNQYAMLTQYNSLVERFGYRVFPANQSNAVQQQARPYPPFYAVPLAALGLVDLDQMRQTIDCMDWAKAYYPSTSNKITSAENTATDQQEDVEMQPPLQEENASALKPLEWARLHQPNPAAVLLFEDKLHRLVFFRLCRVITLAEAREKKVSLHGCKLNLIDISEEITEILVCQPVHLRGKRARVEAVIDMDENDDETSNDKTTISTSQETSETTSPPKKYHYLVNYSKYTMYIPFTYPTLLASRSLMALSFSLNISMVHHDARVQLLFPHNPNVVSHNILRRCLTLPSSNVPNGEHYEQLEFLGDAVLQYYAALVAFVQRPDSHEGVLQKYRQSLINNRYLRSVASSQAHGDHQRLPEYLSTQPYVRKNWRKWYSFGSPQNKIGAKTLADVVEAVLGGVYYCQQQTHGIDNDRHYTDAVFDTVKGWIIPIAKKWSAVRALYNDVTRLYEHSARGSSISNDIFTPTTFKNATEKAMYDKPEVDVEKLEGLLGYKFNTARLAVEACTHPSFLLATSYDRLEWLGDTILQLLLTEHIYLRYPLESPFLMTQLRSASASNIFMAQVAVKHGLHEMLAHAEPRLASAIQTFVDTIERNKDSSSLSIGKSVTTTIITTTTTTTTKVIEIEDETTVLNHDNLWIRLDPPKALGDVIEGVFGAIFIDSGCRMSVARTVFERLFSEALAKHVTPTTVQRNPLTVIYEQVNGEARCLGLTFLTYVNLQGNDSSNSVIGVGGTGRVYESEEASNAVSTAATAVLAEELAAVAEEDSDFCPQYACDALLHGRVIIGHGTAFTRQTAKIRAAHAALRFLRNKDDAFWDTVVVCSCDGRQQWHEKKRLPQSRKKQLQSRVSEEVGMAY